MSPSRFLPARCPRILTIAWLAAFAGVLRASAQATSAQVTSAPSVIELREGIAIGGVIERGRVPFARDLLHARRTSGDWPAPQAGDSLPGIDGKPRTWESVRAADNGVIEHPVLQGGYVLFTTHAPQAGVWLLEAAGHSLVFVNGVPRTGDPYSLGITRLPVRLEAGANELLFACARGRLSARLAPASPGVSIAETDRTLPTLIAGEANDLPAAVVLTNATEVTQNGLTLMCSVAGGAPTTTAVAPIPPLSVFKAPLRVTAAPASGVSEQPLEISLRDSAGAVIAQSTLTLPVRARREQRLCTFISEIDGSVQYYAVVPPSADTPRPALVLSLHGASVEASGQAGSYHAKPWLWIVCPTNRRPYGFDWEDWGRWDALEVLGRVSRELVFDPQRVYLTGHSMGGHGTWHLGATFPGRFAALGPSAGWIMFSTYGGAPPEANPAPVAALLQRAAAPSDTLALAGNLSAAGVYILHGDADDNVPVAQARRMREVLTEHHRDFRWHEQPGAGHWWDASDEPGADCVDWAPLFDFFAARRIPATVEQRAIDFRTFSPGVSAECAWVVVRQQERALALSRVCATVDPGQRRFRIRTENVAALEVSAGMLGAGAAVRVELDGQPAIACEDHASGRSADGAENPPADRRVPADGARAPGTGDGRAAAVLSFVKRGDGWVVGAPPAGHKSPARSGCFKDAFRNRALLVYGTAGTPEENAWALARARLDAETFWYRGNGAFEVLSDAAFDAAAEPHRNVILYGHSEMNRAWSALLADSPLRLARGRAEFDGRVLPESDLCALLVRPRPGSDTALVGVVGATSLRAMRATERLPYFVSGVAYPDCTLFAPDVLRDGVGGVRVAGFFGNDWSVRGGEFAWGDAPAKPE